MNPLSRRLRARKTRVNQMFGVITLVMIGSGGLLGPKIHTHRQLHSAVQDELELVQILMDQANAVRLFEREGLPGLEAAERQLLRIAPEEPLPPDFRLELKSRLERSGLGVKSVKVKPSDSDVSGFDDEESGWDSFALTLVEVSGEAAFRLLPAVLRDLSTDGRPALIQSLTLRRNKDSISRVVYSFELAYLHAVPPREEPPVEELLDEMEEGGE